MVIVAESFDPSGHRTSNDMINLLTDIAEPSRRSMLIELLGGPKSVGQLVEATGLKQPNVSNHLAKLRSAGIVRAQKLGRQVFYAIAEPEVAETLGTLLGTARNGDSECMCVEEAVKRYSRSAVAGDESACARLVDTLMAHEVDLLVLYQDFFGAAMRLVGSWYEVGAIDEGQEHLASAITERMLARIHRFSCHKARSDRVAILGCVAGNYHTLGLRMASDYLASRGWTTFYLGANVPPHSFVHAVQSHQADLVLMSSASDEGRRMAAATMELLRHEVYRTRRPSFGVGGPGVVEGDPELLAAGFDFVVTDLKSFAERVSEQFG